MKLLCIETAKLPENGFSLGFKAVKDLLNLWVHCAFSKSNDFVICSDARDFLLPWIYTYPKTMETPYAGFWLRLGALIIDAIVVSIVEFVVFVPLLSALGLGFIGAMSEMDTDEPGNIVGLVAAVVAAAGAYWILATAIQILYFSIMESSNSQATLGKMAMGIKVTDMQGGRLDFTRAFLRNLCKLISNFTMLIGYLMAGFTEKRQALHDLIAGALVVKK
jgi:uncharacterized RDD family membrane protein YckC